MHTISFDILPTEIKTLVIRYANINGNLTRIRLVTSRLNAITDSQLEALKEDTCLQHAIPERLLEIYENAYEQYFSSQRLCRPMSRLIHFQHEIGMIETLTERIELSPRVPIFSPLPLPAPTQRHKFLLLSAFSRILLDTSTHHGNQASDVLAPSQEVNCILPTHLSTTFKRFLQTELSLPELEAIISAINICASKLWSNIFLYRPPTSAVRTFPSLSGYTFNKDQAILTEHTIWRGPRWVARLMQQGPELSQATEGDDHDFLEHGPWLGSQEDGARLAANGLARLIWLERQRRIEIEAKRATQDHVSHNLPDLVGTKASEQI